MKINGTFKLLLLLAISGFMSAFAGGVSPLETMSDTFTTEATDHVLPVMIFWIFVLGGFMAFMMKTWMPLIFGIIVAVIFAMAPELSTTFVTFF